MGGEVFLHEYFFGAQLSESNFPGVILQELLSHGHFSRHPNLNKIESCSANVLKLNQDIIFGVSSEIYKSFQK